MSDHRRCLLARAGTNSEGTISSAPWEDSTKGNHWKPQGDLRDPEEEDTHNSWTVKSRPYQSLNAHPVLVVWESSNAGTGHRGRRRLQSRPAQERERQQCWNRTEGGQGWQQCHNPAPRWIKVARRRETRRRGVIRRRAPLSGTPERSNPNRELVKRKPSSDGGRRIRKRVR